MAKKAAKQKSAPFKPVAVPYIAPASDESAEALVEEIVTPVEEVPVEVALVEDISIEEVPVEAVPVEDILGEEVSAAEPTQSTPTFRCDSCLYRWKKELECEMYEKKPAYILNGEKNCNFYEKDFFAL